MTGDVTGDIDGAIGSFSASLSATNLVAATGSFTTKVSGVAAEFSGNVCASEYYGDGSNLTNLPSAPTSVASFTVNQLGVVTAASITSLVAPHGSFTTKVSGVAAEFSGTVCAATFDGALTGDVTGDIDGATGSFSACISATNLVAATGSFTTKVSGVAAEFSGTVCDATFDGALTGDVTGDIDGATGSFSACISSTNLVAATGSFTTKVSGVAAEFSGNVCAAEFYGGGGNLTGISSPTSVASFTVNELGVVTDLGVGTASSNPDTIFHVEGSSFISEKLETTGTSKQVDITFEAPTGSATHGLIFQIATSIRSAWYLQEAAGTFDFRYGGGGTTDSYMKWTDTEVVINDGSEDLDFRVESDGNDKMLWVRADNNAIGIGCDPAPTEILKVGTESGADGTQYDILKFQGAGSGPMVCIFRDDIGTSTTTIMNVAISGVGGGMAFISGGSDPHTFTEMVVWANQGGVSVFGTATKNSPPARTYSVSGNDLQLAYASGTHKTAVWAICMRSN